MASIPPFRIMLTMRIHPGREAEFEQTWLRIGDGVTSHPANLGQWLIRSEDEPSTYYITSDWVDEEKFREFERSAGHLEHRKILHPLRASGTMVTGSVVAHLESQRGRDHVSPASLEAQVPATLEGQRGRDHVSPAPPEAQVPATLEGAALPEPVGH